MSDTPSDAPPAPRFAWLRPSHQHSAFSASLLLMSAIMLSRVIGYVREAYIAWAFGAGPLTDAYVAAFTIPDWLNYLVAGGTASITFISIFTRYVAEQREQDAHKAFSVVITVMSVVLVVGIGLMMLFTPQIERVYFHDFTPQQLELCIYLTRILLPAQLFFYVGGVVSSVLLARRMFLVPALAPLFYNVFIILGGIVLGPRFGIEGLAWGALAGAFVGPFLINAIGSKRAGVGYKLDFDTSHPGFREWVRLSIPLMLGVSLITADEWIMRYFAAGGAGDITRLNYAKRLFAVPIAVLGQAVGQASLPFFARLFGEKKFQDFAASVNNSVYRVVAVALLASAWMTAGALPLIDLVYRRGRFTFSDAQETAIFFFWFALSLALWSAQSLYSRAFYAAGDTLTPMVAGTIITIVSLPMYSWLFHRFSVMGLAIASDLGILMHTLVIALLLHHRKLVPLSGLRWGGLGKAAATTLVAGAAAWSVSRIGFGLRGRWEESAQLALITVTWAGATAAGLWLTRSDLLHSSRKRTSA